MATWRTECIAWGDKLEKVSIKRYIIEGDSPPVCCLYIATNVGFKKDACEVHARRGESKQPVVYGCPEIIC